jgi:hypothetical protein
LLALALYKLGLFVFYSALDQKKVQSGFDNDSLQLWSRMRPEPIITLFKIQFIIC